jgi:hypothetical protein
MRSGGGLENARAANWVQAMLIPHTLPATRTAAGRVACPRHANRLDCSTVCSGTAPQTSRGANHGELQSARSSDLPAITG